MNSETKTCQNCKAQFTIEPDDFGFYEKMGVPAPKLCPECRFKRRALFRNEISLYTRTCDRCKKNVVSIYHPKSPYTIYCEECWKSDTWDPHSYAQSYDEKRSFFDQLAELFRRVPKQTTFISTSSSFGPNINSEYTNVAGGNKDCYLVFNGGNNENCAYMRGITSARDTLDGYFGVKLERCYEVINVNQSSGVAFGQHVTASIDSSFLLNVNGSQHCFGCVNLRNGSYQFMNERLSKEEYERRVSAIRGNYGKTEKFKRAFDEFSLKFPRRATSNLKSVNSEGDYIFESKNVRHSFEAHSSEDCRYLFSVKYAKDCYDLIGFGYDSELLLENVGVGYSNRVMASYATENSQNVSYSFMVRNSKDCLGCDGIKGARYSILNRRYEEKEYSRLRETIVVELTKAGEYGLFMPPSLAPFGYNETVGQENMPLTRDEAIAQGLPWQDSPQMTKGKETLKPEKIPDHIRDVSDSILNEILACVACGRNYRIIPAELQLYRQLILPIPRKCFFCRHAERIRRRGPMKLFDRTCDHCKKPIKTSYAPDRKEIVYCEECYQREVV